MNLDIIQIVNSSPNCLYIKNLNGVYGWCNDGLVKLLKLSSPAEIIGKTDHELFAKEIADQYRENDIKVIATNTDLTFEEPFFFSSYQDKVINLSHKAPLRDKNGNVIGIFGDSINITKQKKTEENLIKAKKELRTYLSSIAESIGGSIYWKNRDGVYVGCNTFAAKMAGLSNPEEIIGKTDYDLFRKEEADVFRKNDLEVLQQGAEFSKEEQVTAPNGKLITQLSTKKALKDEQGNVIGIIGNTIDITYLKETETKLKAAKELAEQSNILKSEFIHNMEHDIRTPFGGILGLSSILFEQEACPHKKELLEKIKNSAKELLDFCNALLDFSKLEQISLPALEKQFNLKVLLERIIAMEHPSAKLKNIEIYLDYPSDMPTLILGDEFRLYRVILNLLSNSIKFTKQGYAKISAHLIKKREAGTLLQLTVQDTGIGISKETQNVIFQKFVRGTPRNKGLYKGAGLGLYIVKQFLHEMNGEIMVQSEEGVGTTFTCIIPIKISLLDGN